MHVRVVTIEGHKIATIVIGVVIQKFGCNVSV